MHFRVAANSKDLGGKPARGLCAHLPWLGAALSRKNGTDLFTLVHSDSPAEVAGIAPGDEAVAIDGLRLTASNIDRRLRNYRAGDKATITVFRDHILMRHQLTLENMPEDTGYLTIAANADDAEDAQRCAWLN